MKQPPYQIKVTTYEKSLIPVLTHIFYGQTLKQAQAYAKSHLKTDYFFSSSFLGKMKWNNTILVLSNEYEILSVNEDLNDEEVDRILDQLQSEAEKIGHVISIK